MDVVKRLVSMLEQDNPRKRIAAAVVLGELRVKDAQVVARLAALAKDPLEAYAEAALEALESIASIKALPALMEALERPGQVGKLAGKAIAALGEEALPELKKRLEDATPERRALLAQLLPSLGGRSSFALTLENLRGQPPDAANRVALSVRHEVKDASLAERKALAAQTGKFLANKKTREDEPALRAGLKILGFLAHPDSAETLFAFAQPSNPIAVRVEAVTALRFVLGTHPTKSALNALIDLLEDREGLIIQAARTTLAVLPLTAAHADSLERLAGSPDLQIAKWAIETLGSLGAEVASKRLAPIAAGADRARAEAAIQVLARLPDGERQLASALAKATSEVGAGALAEALAPLGKKLGTKEIAALLKAGTEALDDSVALGRRILDPVREVAPEKWAQALREAAKGAMKKEPGKAETLLAALARSSQADDEDRYGYASMLLGRSPRDLHPKARQRDAALMELERLADGAFELSRALEKDKRLDEETRFYVGFHFVEQRTSEARSVGVRLLEGVMARAGRTKLGKAAKNKLALIA